MPQYRKPLACLLVLTILIIVYTVHKTTRAELWIRIKNFSLVHGKTSRMPKARTFQMPLILHQVFIKKEGQKYSDEMLYERYRPLINSCLTVNANWTYYLWRHSDALALITKEYPQYLNTYKGFKDVLQRSDAIRYLVLHKYGGVYIDMDVECFKPFHPKLTREAAFVDQERLEQTRILWQREFCAINSLMGSVPGHPFYRIMAERVLTKEVPGGVVESTGPLILTEVFKEYRNSSAAKDWPVRLLPPSELMDSGPGYWKELCSKANMRGNSTKLSWRDRGCRMLQSKNWRIDETNKDSLTVHRWMHLGYGPREREALFNVTKTFGSRVNSFSSSASKGQRPN